jgi:hypothetical protein
MAIALNPAGEGIHEFARRITWKWAEKERKYKEARRETW